jgi:hypothetical protein
MSALKKTMQEMRVAEKRAMEEAEKRAMEARYVKFANVIHRRRELLQVYDNGGSYDPLLYNTLGIDVAAKPVNACLVNMFLFMCLVAEENGYDTLSIIEIIKTRLGGLSREERYGFLPSELIQELLKDYPYGVYLNSVDGQATEMVAPKEDRSLVFWVKCLNNHYTLCACGPGARNGIGAKQLHRTFLESQKNRRLQMEQQAAVEEEAMSNILANLSPAELAANGLA